MRIAFLGAGKMAEAILFRLRSSSFGGQARFIASDVDQKRLALLKRKYKIKVTQDNREAFEFGDVVVLAVKPQQMGEVLGEVTRNAERVIRKRKLVISIAAGIPSSYLQRKLPGMEIIRVMPNNPALVGAGITAIAYDARITHHALRITNQIFSAVGEVLEVPERLMDAVTGLSGSGPAFVYEAVDGLISGGVAAGLSKETATKLALQTIIGSAQTVKQSGLAPSKLREMVASPGGTTIEGLKVLDKMKFKRALTDAVGAAAKKAGVLSRQWAK